MSRAETCRYINSWIDDLRSDLYVAISVEKLLKMMNEYLRDVGKDGVGTVTRGDLEMCIKFDDTVRIVKAGEDAEVLLLWSGWRLEQLVSRIIGIAAKEGEALVSAP
jgi:hypothetical protein